MNADEINVDEGTQRYLLDLESGIAYSPAWPATWATEGGGELTEDRVAFVARVDKHGGMVVACPWCRTARGHAVLHSHGADEAADGVYGHRHGSGPGDCAREGYVVIDRGQLDRHLEARDGH